MKRKLCSPVSQQTLGPFLYRETAAVRQQDTNSVETPPAASKSMYGKYDGNGLPVASTNSSTRPKNGHHPVLTQATAVDGQAVPGQSYHARQPESGLYGVVQPMPGQTHPRSPYGYPHSIGLSAPVPYSNPASQAPSHYSIAPGAPIQHHHRDVGYSVQRAPTHAAEVHYGQNLQHFPQSAVVSPLQPMPRPVYPPSQAPNSSNLKKQQPGMPPSFQDILNETLGVLGEESEKRVEKEARALQDLLETKLRREAMIMASAKVPDVARTDSADAKDKKARRLASNRSAASRSRLRKQAYSDAMEKLSLKMLTALLRLRALHGYAPTQFERERDMNVLE